MEFLTALWLGTPAWSWLVFLTIVVVLLAFDLGVLNKKDHVIGVKESLKLSALYIAAGLLFGCGSGMSSAAKKACTSIPAS